MMTEESNCYGCISMCAGKYSANDDGSCPCTLCLVKMVCGAICDKWNKWKLIKRETSVEFFSDDS